MMNELLKALDDIILELNSLSDEQLQANFEACKGGLIGSIMLNSQHILPQNFEVFLSKYSVSMGDMSSLYRQAFLKRSQVTLRIDDIVEAANDERYLMAA
jgi:hypothetical protein